MLLKSPLALKHTNIRHPRTHYGPTRIRRAGFSLCHRRDGRAGTTTILQQVSAPDVRTKALPINYGPGWTAGARATPLHLLEQRDRSTCTLRDYGQEQAASSRRQAVGTAGPFQALRAYREQRTLPSTPPGPQYLQRTTGQDRSAGWLCWSALPQADDTNQATIRERAGESVRCSGFWATR